MGWINRWEVEHDEADELDTCINLGLENRRGKGVLLDGGMEAYS